MPLHTRILLGLLLGASAGVGAHAVADERAVGWIVRYVTEPVGRVWLNALIMVVVPLVVSTISLGVAGLGNLRALGRIGGLTLGCFLVLTALGTAFGLVLVNLIRPGDGLPADVVTRLMETYRGQSQNAMGLATGRFGVDLFVNIVPRNPLAAAASGDMLAVIFFALVVGVALTQLPRERARLLVGVLDAVGHLTITIIDMVMRLAPIGVFCLIFSVTARFGFEILLSLLWYVSTVLIGLAVFQVVIYSVILRLLARRDPMDFFRKARIVMLTAFSTSSSNATLPTTLRVAEQDLKIPPQIAGFVVPLGATMNMNGTALFEGVTVLFVAQVFGIELGLPAQVIVLVMSVVTAIGTAGIPGGSIPLLMMVLGMVGAPMEGIAIVLGVDRILDMGRTVLNVTGDLVTATVVDRFEGASVRSAQAAASLAVAEEPAAGFAGPLDGDAAPGSL